MAISNTLYDNTSTCYTLIVLRLTRNKLNKEIKKRRRKEEEEEEEEDKLTSVLFIYHYK